MAKQREVVMVSVPLRGDFSTSFQHRLSALLARVQARPFTLRTRDHWKCPRDSLLMYVNPFDTSELVCMHHPSDWEWAMDRLKKADMRVVQLLGGGTEDGSGGPQPAV